MKGRMSQLRDGNVVALTEMQEDVGDREDETSVFKETLEQTHVSRRRVPRSAPQLGNNDIDSRPANGFVQGRQICHLQQRIGVVMFSQSYTTFKTWSWRFRSTCRMSSQGRFYLLLGIVEIAIYLLLGIIEIIFYLLLGNRTLAFRSGSFQIGRRLFSVPIVNIVLLTYIRRPTDVFGHVAIKRRIPNIS